MATVMKDKKAVSFISTQCNVRGDETVHRKQKDETYIEVPTIPTVTIYNKYMVGRSQRPNVSVLQVLKVSKEVVVPLVLVLLRCEHC